MYIVNNKLYSIILFFHSLFLLANDGAYYASGNQLIPIEETDVSVKKEVLNIVKKGDYIYVNVDYTFYNHGKEKRILVGFEAPSPSGDVDGYPKDGGHPYIYDFSVVMNGKILTYKKAIVNEEHYFQNREIHAKNENEVLNDNFDPNYPDFYYVYYFYADFKKGENKIVHTYRFKASGSVMHAYEFDYILTAVNRWKNRQIDDFTLHIDMGDHSQFTIDNTFCNSKDWIFQGGRVIENKGSTGFSIEKGGITFKKKNFSPQGELNLRSAREYYGEIEVFNYEKDKLPNGVQWYMENIISLRNQSTKTR